MPISKDHSLIIEGETFIINQYETATEYQEDNELHLGTWLLQSFTGSLDQLPVMIRALKIKTFIGDDDMQWLCAMPSEKE